MLTINICVGSACHLKGSYDVVVKLQNLINRDHLQDKVQLKGSFCIGNCTKGVSVQIENEEHLYSLSEDNVIDFFENEVKRRVQS